MGKYTDLWKKQKQSGVYQTKDGGKVYKNEAARQADKAVQAAVQSAQNQQASGKYKTRYDGVVTATPKPTTSYVPKTSGVTVPTLANTVSLGFTPVVQPVKAKPVNVQAAIKSVDGSAAAVDAYRKRLAANQRRTTNQGMYNDEERNVNAPVSTGASDTFGYAMTPGNGYKTYAQQKAEAEAAAKEEADRLAYQQWIAQQQKLAEQKAMEEELLEEEEMEEELDPMESYLQAILDAQNAQSQALINALMGQSGSLNAQYDANAANMYEMYRRGQLAFPELMSGTATGLADSFSLQNNLNFQNNLSDNELARAAALDALQVQANQVQADAELQAAQTAADWAKMMYQQRLANQNKGSSGKGSGTKKDEDDGYVANTIPEVKQYLELQLGMGNNMTYDNIISILKDMYNAGAISKSLAVDAAAQYGITLHL